MPEGPEIYYLKSLLKKKLLGKYFLKIISNTKTIRNLPQKSKIIDIDSKGKLLWIKTKKYYVHLHMGLTGWIVEEKPKIYKYSFIFNNEELYLKDQRRFSSVNILNEKLHKEKINNLGIDIHSKKFTYNIFKEKMNTCSRNISALLLDQSVFCGIGNYIRNEALYLSKINPTRKVCDMNDKEIKKLYDKIKFVVFSKTIEWLKINNLNIPQIIKDNSPKKLSIPYKFRIYEKNKIENIKVKTSIVAGRKTYYTEQQK